MDARLEMWSDPREAKFGLAGSHVSVDSVAFSFCITNKPDERAILVLSKEMERALRALIPAVIQSWLATWHSVAFPCTQARDIDNAAPVVSNCTGIVQALYGSIIKHMTNDARAPSRA